MQFGTSLSPRGHNRRTRTRAVAPLASALLLLAIAGAAPAQTLERVRQAGTLKLGYLVDARPFSYRDGSGKPAGYAVDLCEKIAGAVKQDLRMPQLRTEFVPVGFSERLNAVKQEKIDLLCAAGTVTLGRREQVDFSIPVFPGGVAALMRTDAPARMREILAGRPEPQRPRWRASLGQILEKRVFAVVAGTTAETWLAEKLDEFDIIAKIEPVEDNAAGAEMVVARRADVLFGDRAILLDVAKRSPSADDLMVLERQFTHDPYAMALERGDADLRLLVDRALSRLYRSGAISEIYTRSLGEPGEEAKRFFEMTALPE